MIHRFSPKIASFVLLVVLQVLAPCMHAKAQPTDLAVNSPNGKIEFQLLLRDGGRIEYQVTLQKGEVIEPSKVGIVLDGRDLGQGARLENVERYEMNERYPSRGVHATAVNNCRGAKFSLVHEETNTPFVLEVRAFDDGVAFRHVVPGEGERTPDAAIEFKIPAGSTVWHHDLHGHYEDVHTKSRIDSVPDGEWIAPPLTIKLPDDAGYAAITEAGLVNYAGMALQARGNRVVRAALGHAHPVGYPFELRFSDEDQQRLAQPAAIEGEIVTPWRVVLVGQDLNTLVNSDIIENVSPLPVKAIFPDGQPAEWIKPGRAVWKYLDGGESNLEGMRDFSRWAGELGFEYNLIEGFWQRWSKDDLRSLVDYSRQHGVGIWLWKDSRALRTPESRQEFFGLCRDVGVVGTKIDFLDHEAKEVIDLYHTLLKEAAEHQLMVNFHGSNKPSGEARMWPNELTREGVRGMEARRVEERSRHDATLPFTRYLAGHGDYTPLVFGERRGDSTAAHQIATAAIFTSPLLVYGGHPQSLLKHPAVDIIKSIPSVWDETIALPPSEIGELAVFARRRGDQWFLAILAGPNGGKVQLPLSFLDSGPYRGMLVSDVPGEPTEVVIEHRDVTSADEVPIELANGGGFIGRFTRQAPDVSQINGQ